MPNAIRVIDDLSELVGNAGSYAAGELAYWDGAKWARATTAPLVVGGGLFYAVGNTLYWRTPAGVLLPVALSVRQFDYYVDSVAGNDSNDGLTSATPKKTIGALPALTSGMRIGLACGSTWREQITVPENGITIGTYGTGAKPLLDCSDAIAAGAWTKTVGMTNVYQATVSPALAASETWVRAWEDNTSLVRAASVAACDATAGSYYPSSDTVAPITLYVHATDSSNPATSGKVYEFNARQSGILSNPSVSDLTVSGIHTRRNLFGPGSIIAYRNAHITDCKVEDGTKHNIYVGEGSYLENVEARNAYSGGQARSHFICYQPSGAGLGFTAINCQAIDDAYIATEVSTGFYQHTDGVGDLGVVYYENISGQNLVRGLDTGTQFTSLEVNGSTWTDCDYAVDLWKSATFKNLTANIKTDKRAFTFLATGITLTLQNSTLTMSGAYSSGGMIHAPQASSVVILSNVSFVSTVNTCGVSMPGATSTLAATLNNFDGITQVYNLAADIAVYSDFNRFHASWYSYVIGGTNYAGLAAWQATGNDVHSNVA